MLSCERKQAWRRALACPSPWIPIAAAVAIFAASPASADFDPVDPELFEFAFAELPAPKLLVSASDTDPYVQTPALAFSGLFNLHLWWVDSQARPVSAIHVGITHNFTFLGGFTSPAPLLGSGDNNLRVYMNGCYDEESPPAQLLLGTWTGFATGSGIGIVCIQENQDSDVLGYVDCELPVPNRRTRVITYNFRNDFTIYCADLFWNDWVGYVSGYDTYSATVGDVSACAISVPGPGSGIVSVDAIRIYPAGSNTAMGAFNFAPNANTTSSFNAQRAGNWYGFSSVVGSNVAAGLPVEIGFAVTIEEGVTEQEFENLLLQCYLGTDEAGPDGTIAGGSHLAIVPLSPLVSVRPDVSVSTEHGLFSIQPNPASGAMMIRFALPRASGAELRVVDVAGRLVRSLIRGNQTAGVQDTAWDGRDQFGKQVAPGTYFVDLRADGLRRTEKVTIVR